MSRTIQDVLGQMQELLLPLEAAGDARRHFLGIYVRMTTVVVGEIQAGGFLDPAWVERLDVVFVGSYLDALVSWDRGDRPSRPWEVAFVAARRTDLPPLRHVLIGINAHINYDLPLALLEVISDREFADKELLAKRMRDYDQIDKVLARRVPEEDRHITAAQGGKSLYERAKTPLERMATARFLKEARSKVWDNTLLMVEARRRADTPALDRLKSELELRSAAKLEQLLMAREVLLQLWLKGFGIRLGKR